MRLSRSGRGAWTALAALALVALGTADAGAVPLETVVVIESEEDIHDLLATEQIDEDTFNTLIELFRRGIDLNSATREEIYSLPNLTLAEVDRILSYRRDAGRIEDPAALVAAGILSADRLLAIAPFLLLREVEPSPYATDGWVRFPTVYSVHDTVVPSMALQGRVRSLRNLRAGLATVLTRRRLGEVSYDPGRDALVASGPAPRLAVPKLYVQWMTPEWGAIAGTYQIGFAERLTFDSTDLYTPNGFYPDDDVLRGTDLVTACFESMGELSESPCAGDARYRYMSPDFRWREGLRGVAAGVRRLDLGEGWLQAYAFGSYQSHSIYQYEIYDRRFCTDPREDADAACAAPLVYRRRDDPDEPTTRFSFATLPAMYDQGTVGGNVAYYLDRRTHVGLTAYGATIDWRPGGLDLDFQEWSSKPFGGPFGAVGLSGSFGYDWADVRFEAAHSFDSMIGGGGDLAAIARTTGSWGKNEAEVSLRYYGKDYANPYAGSISAADEADGFRARDEVGARVAVAALVDRRLTLRTLGDFWVTPSTGIPKVLAYVRSDLKLTDALTPGLWFQYQDKGLGQGGSASCFEISTEEDELGEPVPCNGMKLEVTARLRWQPVPSFWLTTQAEHEWVDDPRYPDRMRQDVSAWLLGTVKVSPNITARGRIRYLFDDLSDNTYLEQSVRTYLGVDVRQTREFLVRARYDLNVYVDDRASTLGRRPNPEHVFRLEAEAWF